MGRSNSASGVSVDDPTDKSEGTSSFIFQPTKHDIVPLVLAVLTIAAGLTAGLLSFFLLQNGEHLNARNALEVERLAIANELNSAFDAVIAVVMSTATFFQVAKTPITLYDQFVPYVMSSGSFPKYLSALTYSRYIPIAQEDAFVQEMRATGLAEYVNFTITGRDENNNKIIAPWTPVRCVVVQTVPSGNMNTIVGYDPCSSPEKNTTFHRAIDSRKPAASGGVLSAFFSNAVSLTIMVGLYNNTDRTPTGMFGGVILLSDLIDAALYSIIDGYDVTLYDMNATTEHSFLYTKTDVTSRTVTATQAAEAIATASYTFSANVNFADRVFKAVLVPTANYEHRFEGTMKYIALTISLVIMGVLLIGCLLLYFARKLIIAKKRRGEANIQIDLLKTNQGALRTLLDRIACQESKTRAVINSLPDLICVISATGKILQTNSAFDDEFPFNQKEMEKGVYSWDVFTELASDFFRVCDETQEIQTQAARRFGDLVSVSVRIRDLRGKSGESSTSQSNEIKVSGGSTIPLPDLEEAYVIIARNTSVKLVHNEISTQERVQRHEFERKFRDKQFREELRVYCEKNQNVENILFLEQVKEYKKAQFAVRVDMKTTIFDRFIKIDAPMQLNLANEVVQEESIKINKSMGDVDVFRNVEECVIKMLANDTYPRFLLDQRKMSVIETVQ